MDNFALGEYNVGFRHEMTLDYARSFGEGHRPVQMFIWYPSSEDTKFMNYTEYFLFNELSGKPVDKIQFLDAQLQLELQNLDISDSTNAFSAYKELKTIL